MNKHISQIRKPFFYKVLTLNLFLMFSSISIFADSQIYEEQQEIIAMSERAVNQETSISSIFYAYIIIPAKFVDNVVTDVISIVIPIKGAAAATTNPPKKSIQEEVMEAIRGSEENIRVKNREAYLDGLTTGLNVGGNWEKAMEHMQDPELQKIMQNAMGIIKAQQQNPEFHSFLQQQAQTRQKLQTDAKLLNLFNTNSEQVKEYYRNNPSELKKIFEQIINSDLAQELKDKAQVMLDILNTNAARLNPQEIVELFTKSIKNGGAALIVCQTICTGSGTFMAGVATGGAALLPGFGASLAEYSALCGNLGGITAAATAVGNMYFKEGSGSE